MSLRRIPFDSLCLSVVVHECQGLVGASVQRVVQPDETSLVLELYGKGLSRLTVCWHAEYARAHLTESKAKGAEPLMQLCAAARKHLTNGRVAYVRQRGLDRILEIGVTTRDGEYVVVAELMGKHSNLMVVDGAGRIVACGKTVGRGSSSRPVRVGAVYEAPPVRQSKSVTEAVAGDELMGLEGVSPFLADLVRAGFPLEGVQAVFLGGAAAPVLVDRAGAYPVDVSVLGLKGVGTATLSAGLETAFAQRIDEDQFRQARQGLLRQLHRVLDARAAALHGLEAAAHAAETAPLTQTLGELILAYQGTICEGAKDVRVHDYEGKEVTISLDPELSAVENANKMFKRARHAKDRAFEVDEQRKRIQFEHDEVARLLLELEAAVTLAEAESVRSRAEDKLWLNRPVLPQKKEDRPYEGHSVRELVSPAGFRVLYGTNATSNDFLTTRVAKGNDLWFHVRGQNSAHVVLCTRGMPEKVQTADLVFAAQTAVRNSPAKHSSHVPVDYTLKKHVRKPRGSAVGLVVYEREKTLHVDP